jgi:hypothetical protein
VVEWVSIGRSVGSAPDGGLGWGKIETSAGAFLLHDGDGFHKVVMVSSKNTVIQEPSVCEEVGNIVTEFDKEGLNNEGEEKGSERVALVEPDTACKPYTAPPQMGLVTIAEFGLDQELAKMMVHFVKHFFPVNKVEGICKVYLETHFHSIGMVLS